PSFSLLNPESMRLINSELNTQNARELEGSYRDLVHLRASADGRVFGLGCTSHTPSGMGIIHYTEAMTRPYYVHNSCRYVVPGPDGRTLYTRLGRYQLAGLGQPPERLDNDNPMLPACRGDQYLILPAPGRGGAPTVEVPGKERPIATLAD